VGIAQVAHTGGTVAAARQAAAPVILLKGERVEAMQCPACGDEEARCIGVAEEDWDIDWEYEDGQPQTTVYGSVQFYPGRFECSVCELELRGGDELEAGGIELSWTLDEDLDPA
jgi:hypothetical protein